MKKRIFSSMMVFGVSLFLLLTAFCKPFVIESEASDITPKGIVINNEYSIPDSFDWCTCYVLVATNKTGKDVAVNADFYALDKDGNILSRVNDYSEAVKKDQQFILYGQFLNENIRKAAKFEYHISMSDTDNCTYTSVDIGAKNVGKCIEVSATNYSGRDIQGVGVRAVFLKNGKPVALDTVNIADVGYTFHGGSTNSQMLGYNAGNFDDYILTYTSAGENPVMDF